MKFPSFLIHLFRCSFNIIILSLNYVYQVVPEHLNHIQHIPGGKYFKNSFVWNIVSINALWVWWKCRCNKKYEGIDYNVVDMIKMFWDNLIHTVKGEYDNIKGTTEMVHKKRRRIRQIWWPIPLWLDGNYVPPRWSKPNSMSRWGNFDILFCCQYRMLVGIEGRQGGRRDRDVDVDWKKKDWSRSWGKEEIV